MTALEKKCWRFAPWKKKRNGVRTWKKFKCKHASYSFYSNWKVIRKSEVLFFCDKLHKVVQKCTPGSETHGANMLNGLVGEVRFVGFGSALVIVTLPSISTCLNGPTTKSFFYHQRVHGCWGSNMHSNAVYVTAYVHMADVIAEL